MKPGDLVIKNRSHNYSLPRRRIFLFVNFHEETGWGYFLAENGEYGHWALDDF